VPRDRRRDRNFEVASAARALPLQLSEQEKINAVGHLVAFE
jgi:hypothetical protein